MSNVLKNDGTWKAKPSGMKTGNLKAWRDMMYQAIQEPEVDDIVVDQTTSGEIIGYLCTVANGYDSYWKRVAKPLDIPKVNTSTQPQAQVGWGKPQYSEPSNIFYTQRAKAGLSSNSSHQKYNEPPVNYDDDIPF